MLKVRALTVKTEIYIVIALVKKFKAYEDEYKEYKEKLDKFKREKFVNCAYISESIRRMSKKKNKK